MSILSKFKKIEAQINPFDHGATASHPAQGIVQQVHRIAPMQYAQYMRPDGSGGGFGPHNPSQLQVHSASYLNQEAPGGQNHVFVPQQQTYRNPQMGFGVQVQGLGSYQQPLQAGYRGQGIQAQQSYLNLQ